MIVQCEHCQTKYRIPDEKVKGKAAKVRCTKCNNTFTVYPESEPAAAAGAEKAQPVATASPPPTEPPEPSPPEPEPESSEAPEPPPDSSQQETASPPVQSPEEFPVQPPGTPAAESEAEAGLTGDDVEDLLKSISGDFEPPPMPEDPDGTRSLRPAHEFDRGAPSTPAENEPPQQAIDEFKIESTLREDQFEPLQTSTTPRAESGSGGSPAADEEMGWGNIALDSEPDKQSDDDGIGLANGADFQPPPPPPPIFDDKLEESPESEAEPMPGTASIPSYITEKSAPKRGRTSLFIFLILAALGAGGYFAYPKIMEIINPLAQQPVGTLTPDKIQVRSLSREDGNLIYTVRGIVRNDSSGSVGMVQVEAQFRNTAGTIVAKSSVYCGNIFDDTEIISGDLGKILGDLQNELGQSLSNQGIQPGQDVPFLIVLENPPSDVSKVTVTISGFKETT